MQPATIAWLANLRAQAADPGNLCVVIPRRAGGSVAIFPDDILGKSDDELAAYVVARLTEQPNTVTPGAP
ncbi:hypothetical protein [Massilia sp. 9096]|uniref:hypothetical protein n=1 Tax=Massilia sp. 9096 TaxID=1500894 RepID=UPI00056B4214|nr:hypothetical protein [Massilia sp. 9096]